ncbi:MAG: G-D-S-L family lipolytic protein, partial [Akkermansiaceae bacterium]
MKIRNLILATLCVISAAAHAETAASPLKKDDRIVFLGDSITAGGVKPGGYVTLIKDAIAATHPDL